MHRSKSTLIVAVAIVAAVAAAIAIVIAVNRPVDSPPPPTSTDSGLPETLAADTHRLDDPAGATVTVVEFLDFECEACGAFYPLVEQARADYDGQIVYAIRYFPLPGHHNSENAAVAVEAAARQGRLEDMYHRMFQTQTQWGERQDSQAALFRTFAVELGLDVTAYDRDVADPAVLERVQADLRAGLALGVQGTPTFFVNDQPVQVTSIDSLDIAIAAELERSP